MNVLQEFIQVSDEVSLDDIKSCVPKIKASLQLYQIDVERFIENVYVTYRETPKRNRILATKLNELNEEVDNLHNKISELNDNELIRLDQELNDSIELYKRFQCTADYLQQVSKCHESLLRINDLLNDNEFVLCVEEIEKLEEIFEVFTSDGKMLIPALTGMHLEFCTIKQQLHARLEEIFQDHIILMSDDKCTIQIRTDDNLIESALIALYRSSDTISYLDDITRFLWENIFTRVVDNKTEIVTKSDEKWQCLEIQTIDPNQKSHYLEVFNQISIILEFFEMNFNYKLDDLTTLQYIGRDLSDNLSELLIKHCLDATIPTDAEDLKNCQELIKNTEILETKLLKCGIFTKQTTSIYNYIKNIDDLFINKKCENYRLSAIDLMKKDLHDMVEIGERLNKDSLTITQQFPHCCISKNILEILKFVENILEEAKNLQQPSFESLLKIVKNILRTYPKFVMEHHKKLLQTIPQQIALFYNNCAYISHVLTNWPTVYNNDLDFIDEIRQLEHISKEIFDKYVDDQIKQIVEIIKDSGLNQHQTLEKLNDDNVEKSLRQCLRQQELLKTVWHKVLPYNIYNNVIGQIFDCLCTNLIESIIKFEDISATAAEQLLELIKMVQTRGPKLFTDSNEISLFVKNWYKLNELSFVLNASLIDINDRWANGKGPLALQFKPNEMRSLVRTLFQNTERRAALLRQIHD